MSHVKREYETELRRFLADVPEDKLLSFVGDDFTKKVVRAHNSKVQAKIKQPQPKVVGEVLDKKKTPEPANLREFFRNK